jgi:hypothetical protein
MLVLLILPLGSYSFLEEVVVGFLCEFGNGSNVVLVLCVSAGACRWRNRTYVDTPELLNRVKSDDLLKQIVPIVTLSRS